MCQVLFLVFGIHKKYKREMHPTDWKSNDTEIPSNERAVFSLVIEGFSTSSAHVFC